MNAIQRLISKESFVGEFWNSAPSWSGPVARRIPVEAGIHRLLPRNPHIIEYLGFHVNKQLRMVRHYTTFADSGDLMSLACNHVTPGRAVDEHGKFLPRAVDANGNAIPPLPIPVVAVVYIFQAMAAGACLMAHGEVPDDEGRLPDNQSPAWNHDIIHRDIKPANYFLSSSESSAIWPRLPIAALGDFGNAFDATSLMGARSSHAMGTKYYMAPEQVSNEGTTYTVTSATNIYQIGLTILTLMHLQVPGAEADFDHEDRVPFPGFPNGATFYPQDLIDLAEDCVQLLPRNRPKPIKLYKDIRDLATSYPNPSSKDVPWRKC